MASDSWRYPLTMLPDYMGPGTPMERYQKQRAELVTAPAETQNAVAIAAQPTAAPSTQSAAAPTADAPPKVSTAATPQRNSNTVSGPVSPYAPNANVPYPGGESPATRAASILPGMPTIQFNAPPQPVAQGAQGMRSNLGMISPNIDYEAATLLDEARPLLRSAGIVDRLRGRQAMRARSRLLADAANLASVQVQGANAESGRIGANANMLGAQTGAFRASNEVPLAMLQSATNRYGYDTQRYGIDSQADVARMRDLTDRENNERTNATLRRGQEFSLLPQMESVYRADAYGAARAAGDDERAGEIAREGRFPPAQKGPTMMPLPMGGVAVMGPDGKPQFYNPDEEQKRGGRNALALPAYQR